MLLKRHFRLPVRQCKLAPVRQRPKYSLPKKKKPTSQLWTWFAVGLCLGLLGWLIWRFADSEAQRRLAKREPSTNGPSATPVPPKGEPRPTTTRETKAPDPVTEPPTLPVPSPMTSNPPATLPPFVPAGQTNKAATNLPSGPPPLRAISNVYPRSPETPFELQVALARLNFSPGSIDGNMGPQTRAALRAYQHRMGVRPSGELDDSTRAQLLLGRDTLYHYLVTTGDLARLQPVNRTWLGKSQQSALDYETLPELLAEMSRSSPTLVRRLNPGVRWETATVGTAVQLPDVLGTENSGKAGFVIIRLRDRTLQAVNGDGVLMAHFPCSIASKVEKRPVGELRVQVIVPDPNYTFDPDVFPESEEGRRLGRKLILPPGPNNPVGVAWIGLDRPGYGIHGTPHPEQVGRTESHGCFRLANWNAALLLRLSWIGMPVRVEP